MMSKKLMTFFADLLNDNSITNVMLVGIGNMGHALLHYRFHERNKMKIIMAFDLDDHPEVGTQTPDGIPIYGISQIKEKIKDADVKTAILTVPSVKSQEVANLLVDAGVKGNSQFFTSPSAFTKRRGRSVCRLTSELPNPPLFHAKRGLEKRKSFYEKDQLIGDYRKRKKLIQMMTS